MVEGFRQIDGVCLHCCDSLDKHLSTISLNVEDVRADHVGTRLDVRHHIAVRTGLHCAPRVHQQLRTVNIHGSVRFSIGAFNTEEQVDAAVLGITEVARWGAARKAKLATAPVG
jgi:selenocysteine lyase/cysteine desulfurase